MNCFLCDVDDSDVPETNRPKYREFLQTQSTYRKVIDFKDENIVNKIRLSYRVSYLKDSVISSIIDDPLSSQFNPVRVKFLQELLILIDYLSY